MFYSFRESLLTFSDLSASRSQPPLALVWSKRNCFYPCCSTCDFNIHFNYCSVLLFDAAAFDFLHIVSINECHTCQSRDSRLIIKKQSTRRNNYFKFKDVALVRPSFCTIWPTSCLPKEDLAPCRARSRVDIHVKLLRVVASQFPPMISRSTLQNPTNPWHLGKLSYWAMSCSIEYLLSFDNCQRQTAIMRVR